MSRNLANRQYIITKINWATKELTNALNMLEKENSDGDTFNYITSPKLGHAYKDLEDITARIKAFIYSED